MKRFIISMLALAAIVGCSKDGGIDDVIDNGTSSSALVFTAMFDEVETSRVEVDNATLELSWSANDAISVFAKNAGNSKYTYTGTDNQFAEATTESGAALAKYYAVYPYSSATSISAQGVVSLTLPAEQTYSNASGSLGLGANTMVAVSNDTNLEFQNVCGYLRLNLWGDGVKVKSIKLEGNHNEPLAGAATINVASAALSMANSATKSITLNCGDGVQLGASAAEATPFWFVVPAQEFTEGFTITITDDNNKVMTQSTSTSREVLQNTVHTMTTLKVVTEAVSGDIIFDAQFNLNGSATDKGKYHMEIIEKKGSNMTTISDPEFPYNNVVKFTHTPNNNDNTDSFYLVNYSDESDFKADLEDGFSMEMVVKHDFFEENCWVRPVSANTFGVLGKSFAQDFRFSLISTDAEGNRYAETADQEAAPYFGVYSHYVYVYDNVGKIQLYCNGVCIVERSGLPFAVGNRLAIGGFPLSTDILVQPFKGDVAMVRIYDNVMSADDAKMRYESLSIPQPAVSTPTPLFDAQFNADGTATNVGSYTSLSIQTLPHTDLTTSSVSGFGYVANFKRHLSNDHFVDGFYNADYSADETFKGKLADGFTLEVVASLAEYSNDPYARPFGSNSFGVFTNTQNKWSGYYNYEGGNGEWWYGSGMNPHGTSTVTVVPVLNDYNHVIYVYNATDKIVRMYVQGVCTAYKKMDDFFVGRRFAIGGYAKQTAESVEAITQIWSGNVAVARVYDEALTDVQAKVRYESMKSTISTLNAAQQ